MYSFDNFDVLWLDSHHRPAYSTKMYKLNTNQRFGEQKGQDHHERLLSNKLGELQNKYEEMTGSAELELPKHCVTAARLLVDAKLLSNIL